MILDDVALPIVLAPLAGGPSTPDLTAAVSNAGGFGFLAAGYLSAAEVAERLERTRSLTTNPFGVNLFVVPHHEDQADAVGRYAGGIEAEAASVGVEPGRPRFDEDDWEAKVALLCADPVPVASFTFGLPGSDVIDRLHRVGTEVWVTTCSVTDAVRAQEVGADALVVQGREAGGHRGGLDDDPGQAVSLLPLLQLVRAATDLPLVATGGIATGPGVAAALAAGARAAALGTAFLDCPEAATSGVHRDALHQGGATEFTRAFTGRAARGIKNSFMDRHSHDAPSAYPELHYLTAPMRRAARERGEPGLVNLWAGEAYPLTSREPAGELVSRLAQEARAALRAGAAYFDPTS